MRIAFYAPLKPPTHPAPSGDRRMARMLIQALEEGGNAVELASTFRSFDAGDAGHQARIRAIGERLAARLVRRYRARPPAARPQAWFTYHLYHKAPDWLGPKISRELAIPYLAAEASHAPKQENGPWAAGFEANRQAIGAADLVIGLNAADGECVLPLLGDAQKLFPLKPFIDTAPYVTAAGDRDRHRRELSARHGMDGSVPWLLCVAMMRRGDKLTSYRVLGQALALVGDRPWRLIVAGFGPARADVEAALCGLGDRVSWFGEEMDLCQLAGLYAASDLYVWPAVNEAFGMAFLEAQAAGLAVVAGRTGGVPEVVAGGESGFLVRVGDPQAFAAAVGEMLDDPGKRRAMGAAARRRVLGEHHIGPAARSLNEALGRLAARS